MAAKAKDVLEEVIEMEEEAPVLHIRLCDRRGSGFILDDGKRGTAQQSELDSPTARFLPNWGYRRSYKVENRGGKTVKVPFNEEIRYIKEQTEISVVKQREMGIVRHRANKEDMIEIKRGEFHVVREGSYIGLFDYIKQVFYNKSNPDRSAKADAIYEEVIVDQKEEELNEYDISLAHALVFIGKFYQKSGKGYLYKEDKIEALCQLFEIFAETPAGKITALNAIAKLDPVKFMAKAEKFEQITIRLITHGLQLNVIQITSDGIAQYVEKDKVIYQILGGDKMTRSAQIEKLAEAFQSDDLKGAYEEFKIELEVAREKDLNA